MDKEKVLPRRSCRIGKPNVMSMGKHRVGGHTSKSPKLRHALKREAEKNEYKARKTATIWFDNPSDAVKNFKPR